MNVYQEATEAVARLGSIAAAARELGLAPSTVRDRIHNKNHQKTVKKSAVGDNVQPQPHISKKLTTVLAELREARPKTWFDDLRDDEKTFLLTVRKEYSQKLFRIKPTDLIDRIRTAIPTITLSNERFKRWLNGSDT